MNSHQFCRDICLERGEPMQGAGETQSRYVLLQWPRRHWRVPRINSQEMTPALSQAIVTAHRAGIHVALVEGDDIALSCEDRIARALSAEEAATRIEQLASGETMHGEIDERITILCCTDGKQDPCCARFGFATYKALREHADPSIFRVLQSTHLGGCRFAASLLVLPSRERYGRLEPGDVPDFLQSLQDGLPYLEAYRGNPRLDEASQVAEHAALSFASDLGLRLPVSSVQLSRADQSGGDAEFVAFLNDVKLHIRLRSSAFEVNTRCSTVGQSTSETSCWSVVSLEALD